jgi:hypothetical protein
MLSIVSQAQRLIPVLNTFSALCLNSDLTSNDGVLHCLEKNIFYAFRKRNNGNLRLAFSKTMRAWCVSGTPHGAEQLHTEHTKHLYPHSTFFLRCTLLRVVWYLSRLVVGIRVCGFLFFHPVLLVPVLAVWEWLHGKISDSAEDGRIRISTD